MTSEHSETKLYVGYGATHSPMEFRDKVEELREKLRAEYRLLDFFGMVGGTASQVFETDILQCVPSADLVVIICDYPSFGAGWEMTHAVDIGKPTLALANATSNVSRLVLGAAEHMPNFNFETYNDLLVDAPNLINQFAQSHSL
jgi:nucleoside 2-deoxyribosyltransferase